MRAYLSGERDTVPNLTTGFMHVEDVALAHILGLEVPQASGNRFLCSSVTTTWGQVASQWRELYPAYADKIPSAASNDAPKFNLDTSKIRRVLGIGLCGLDEMLKSGTESLRQLGFIEDGR